MRIAFFLSIAFSLVACGGEQQVGADALWQVRCISGSTIFPPTIPACGGAEDVIDLTVFDGQTTEIDGQMETVSVSCGLSSLTGNNRLMNVSITTRTMAGTLSHALQIRNVTVDATTGAIAGTGDVTIKADDIDLEGRVGAAAPSAGTPCRISPITFNEREEGPTMSFELDCRNISNPANPALTQRDLTFPGMGSMPADINVFNCDGL